MFCEPKLKVFNQFLTEICFLLILFYQNDTIYTNLLKHLNQFQPAPWLCVEDFNEIVEQSEKVGAAFRREPQMVKFWNTLEFCRLSDLAIRDYILLGVTIVPMIPSPRRGSIVRWQMWIAALIINKSRCRFWQRSSDHHPILSVF
jgi:hypothetical protein